MSRPLFATALVLLFPLGLTACGTSDTPSTVSRPDLLGFRSASLDTAYIGEAYSGAVAVTGGVAPYRVQVVGGQLPQGLRLVSSGGTLVTGTPTAMGSSTFTLEVVDANLSVRRQEFSLVVAQLPALDIEAALPPTEIRGETRIPLRIRGPRGVHSLHYTWTLPTGVKVLRVEAGSVLKEMAKAAQGKAASTSLGHLGKAQPGGMQAAPVQPVAGLNGPLVGFGSVQQQPAAIQPAATPLAPTQPSLKWSQQGQQLTLDMTFTGPVGSKAPVALVTVAPVGRTPFTLTQPVAGKESQIRALDAAGVVIRDTLSEVNKTAPPAIKPDVKPAEAVKAVGSASTTPAPAATPPGTP